MPTLVNGSTAHAALTAYETPADAALLERVLARLERIEAKLDRIDALTAQAPALMALATDTVDHMVYDAAQIGIDIDERARLGIALLAQLTDPATITALGSLLDRLGTVATLAEQLPGLVAMGVDVLDELYAAVQQQGVDLETTVRRGLVALRDFMQLLQSPEFHALMESGVLDPQTLSVLGHAASAIVSSRQAAPVSPLGAASALFRKDVQQSLGFVISFAERFGDRLAGQRS